MLRVGILTSGGDCQALNAAMRGVVKGLSVKRNDLEIYGFRDGYKGLIYDIADRMTPDDFSGILNRGVQFLELPDSHSKRCVFLMKTVLIKSRQ